MFSAHLIDLMEIDKISDCHSLEKNIYRLSVSYSWSEKLLTLTQNIDSNSITLEILHFRYDINSKNRLDVDTIYASNSISISADEWSKFNALLDESYFWLTTGFKRELGDIDGSDWQLEGYRQLKYGSPEYHNLQIYNPPRGAFRTACDYLLSLSGEDESEYSGY